MPTQSPAGPPTAARAMRSRDPRSRCFQDRILRVAAERTFERQRGAGGVSHDCQHGLEVVAWRDVEDRKPSQQGRASESRQSLLSAKIDDVQPATGREVAQTRLDDATPVRDHRQAIGNQYVIERPDTEQVIRVEPGSIAMRNANSIGEAAP